MLRALGGLRPSRRDLGILRAGQLSKRRLLLCAVEAAVRAAASRVPGSRRFLRALEHLDGAEAGGAAARTSVLMYPFVDAWAAACLRRLHDPALGAPALDYLGHVIDRTGAHTEPHAGSWLELDDTDPQRDQYGIPPVTRLTDREHALWRQSLDLARVRLIPQGFDNLVEGVVHRVVPLRAAADGRALSASARRSFGAVGISLPRQPRRAQQLAEMAVHEALHVHLWALLDLTPLCSGDGDHLFAVPWKAAPRPPTATLNGAFAHLGLAALWQEWAELAEDADERRHAVRRLRGLRDGTGRVIDLLLGSGVLTEAGLVFTEAMAERFAGGPCKPVDAF
jgi:hypothetical protein